MSLKTIQEILFLSEQYLKSNGRERSRRDAEDLVAFVLKIKRLDLYLKYDFVLTDEELARLRPLLKRRAMGEPLDYIKGEVDFYGAVLNVNPSVLIPRVETEILADHVYRLIQASGRKKLKILDLCCGSGCLGISLKKKIVDCEVLLVDLSFDALETCRMNVKKNSVDVRVQQGDFLACLKEEKFDVIVSNPPYISLEEYERLDDEVKKEPKLALVADNNGCEFYDRLSESARSYLSPQGLLCLEIGKDLGSYVYSLFSWNGIKYKKIEKDWAGHDRFFFLEME
ncbi:MAG: peptide chain release factor N(5)-glutamine methyltransferase [Rhabdochlamydiaceae bacterium]